MEIIPHFPVNNYEAGEFEMSELQAFLKALELLIGQLDDYAKKEDLEALRDRVVALELKVEELEGKTDELDDAINEFKATVNVLITTINGRIDAIENMLNETITVVQCVFTNPDYFYADDTDSEYYNVASSMHSVVASFTGLVKQAVQVADNTLEVVNIQLDDNVTLDFTKTPNHFYTPMCVEHFDAQGNFTSMQTCMLDCELTQEMSGYDISCYFHGDIANVNEFTKFHFSLDFPYFVERSSNEP